MESYARIEFIEGDIQTLKTLAKRFCDVAVNIAGNLGDCKQLLKERTNILHMGKDSCRIPVGFQDLALGLVGIEKPLVPKGAFLVLANGFYALGY